MISVTARVRLGVTEAPGVTWTSDHFQVAALPTLLMNFKTIQVEVAETRQFPDIAVIVGAAQVDPSVECYAQNALNANSSIKYMK